MSTVSTALSNLSLLTKLIEIQYHWIISDSSRYNIYKFHADKATRVLISKKYILKETS